MKLSSRFLAFFGCAVHSSSLHSAEVVEHEGARNHLFRVDQADWSKMQLAWLGAKCSLANSVNMPNIIVNLCAIVTIVLSLVACQEPARAKPIRHPFLSSSSAFYNRAPLNLDEKFLFDEILATMLQPYILGGEDVSRLYQGLEEWVSLRSEAEIVATIGSMVSQKRDAVLSFAELGFVKLPHEVKALKKSNGFPAERITLKDREQN